MTYRLTTYSLWQYCSRTLQVLILCPCVNCSFISCYMLTGETWWFSMFWLISTNPTQKQKATIYVVHRVRIQNLVYLISLCCRPRPETTKHTSEPHCCTGLHDSPSGLWSKQLVEQCKQSWDQLTLTDTVNNDSRSQSLQPFAGKQMSLTGRSMSPQCSGVVLIGSGQQWRSAAQTSKPNVILGSYTLQWTHHMHCCPLSLYGICGN